LRLTTNERDRVLRLRYWRGDMFFNLNMGK